jgi:hypothetical protein
MKNFTVASICAAAAVFTLGARAEECGSVTEVRKDGDTILLRATFQDGKTRSWSYRNPPSLRVGDAVKLAGKKLSPDDGSCTGGRKASPSDQAQQAAKLEADQARCTVYAYQAVPEHRPPQSPQSQYRSDCYGDRNSWTCDTRALGGGNNAPVGGGATWGLQQGQERARTDQARQAAYRSCMYDRGWR